jgi:hypothetical protein
MKRSWLFWAIVANLLVLIGLVFAYPHLMVSPGPLVKAHADLATNCFSCHVALRGTAADKCVACHALPDIGLRTSKGAALPQKGLKTSFHQQLSEQNCMACHTDHAGPKLVQGSRKLFSHALLKPEVRQECATCHTKPANDKLHAQIQGNCAQCHPPTAWKPATFDHSKLFVLNEDHNATCITCHTGNDYSRYTCYGGHEHTPSNILRKHEEKGISDLANCVKCHRSAHGEKEGGGRKGRKRD